MSSAHYQKHNDGGCAKVIVWICTACEKDIPDERRPASKKIHQCLDCTAVKRRAYYARRPEQHRAYQRAARERCPEYQVWRGIIERCCDPKSQNFARYGARGITVCAAWRTSFKKFLADVGQRPTRYHSIEREDNDGNYEPNNCCWATRHKQSRNTRRNRFVMVGVSKLCIVDAAAAIGSRATTIYHYAKREAVSMQEAVNHFAVRNGARL